MTEDLANVGAFLDKTSTAEMEKIRKKMTSKRSTEEKKKNRRLAERLQTICKAADRLKKGKWNRERGWDDVSREKVHKGEKEKATLNLFSHL